MKIVKVTNHLMYDDPEKPNGYHYYAFYYNPRYHKYNAVRLTHIANKDNRRYTQVDNGYIKAVRIPFIDRYADSGITKYNYTSDRFGFDLNPSMGVHVCNIDDDNLKRKIIEHANYNVFAGNRTRRNNRF